jgi:acetyl-CoA carboxylase carboxyl transferase subunit alpha
VNIREMSRLAFAVVAWSSARAAAAGPWASASATAWRCWNTRYYSVISPEGCAAILWKSGDMAEKAATALKLTAGDLRRFGVVDEIVPEPLGGAHRDKHAAASLVKEAILRNLREIRETPTDVLLSERYEKYRRLGNALLESGSEPEPEAESEASPAPQPAEVSD